MGMNKYDRLLYLLNLLRTRRNLGAARLAEECGVTERTIYRDMVALSEANVPIYFDHGYKLASKNFLPPLNIDFAEYNLLKLALDSSPLNKSGVHQELFKRVKAKVEAGLTDAVRAKRLFTPNTTHIEIPQSMPEEQWEQYYKVIEDAVSQSKKVKLVYDAIESGETARLVDPYFIVFRGRAFYFVAFCHLRKEMRTFRVDRVREVIITDEIFQRRDDIDPENYFEGSWELFSGDPVDVEIIFLGKAARVISSSRHHPDEKVTDLGQGRIQYRVTTRGLAEIKRWVLGFGSEAEVIQPEELRADIAGTARSLLDIYHNPV